MKKSLIIFLFFLAMQPMQCFNSFGQNRLLLLDKNGINKYVVHVGKRVKIVTENNKIIRGRISEIKDSSIAISDSATTNVSIDDIKYIYLHCTNGWKIAAVALCILGGTSTILSNIPSLNYGVINTQQVSSNPNEIANLVFGVALYGGAVYLLTNQKKFDTELRYDLMIVRPKPNKND